MSNSEYGSVLISRDSSSILSLDPRGRKWYIHFSGHWLWTAAAPKVWDFVWWAVVPEACQVWFDLVWTSELLSTLDCWWLKIPSPTELRFFFELRFLTQTVKQYFYCKTSKLPLFKKSVYHLYVLLGGGLRLSMSPYGQKTLFLDKCGFASAINQIYKIVF